MAGDIRSADGELVKTKKGLQVRSQQAGVAGRVGMINTQKGVEVGSGKTGRIKAERNLVVLFEGVDARKDEFFRIGRRKF